MCLQNKRGKTCEKSGSYLVIYCCFVLLMSHYVTEVFWTCLSKIAALRINVTFWERIWSGKHPAPRSPSPRHLRASPVPPFATTHTSGYGPGRGSAHLDRKFNVGSKLIWSHLLGMLTPLQRHVFLLLERGCYPFYLPAEAVSY